MAKKYVSLSKLSVFLDNLKNTFSEISHTHKLSEIIDYKVDTALSSTSTNSVQNKVLDAEFEAMATALNILEDELDGSIKSLSVSGGNILCTKNNGSIESITPRDTQVKQNALELTTTGSYPLLLANEGGETRTTETYLSSGVRLNIQTNTISANINGQAQSALKDSAGNQINSHYATKTSLNAIAEVANTAAQDVQQKAQVQIITWEAND